MASTPAFANIPLNDSVNITTANPNRDGTGTIGTLTTAPVGGCRVDDIMIKARATTTTGVIRFFLHDGTTYCFWREVLVTAITPSATVAAFESQLSNLALVLKAGWSIRVATEKGESFDVTTTRMGGFE
jgi:hypothetical protein